MMGIACSTGDFLAWEHGDINRKSDFADGFGVALCQAGVCVPIVKLAG
jgi:hypothetical protein